MHSTGINEDSDSIFTGSYYSQYIVAMNIPAISDLHHRPPESWFHRITVNRITSLPGINLTQVRTTIRLVDLMAPKLAIKALFMRCPVDRTDVQENNGQSCYNALVKV